MQFVYTDEELLLVIARQPYPLTVKRFMRVMNGRIKRDASYRRIKALADQGVLLTRKFPYTRKSGRVTIYGTGDQFRKIDEVWRQGGREALATEEHHWFE